MKQEEKRITKTTKEKNSVYEKIQIKNSKDKQRGKKGGGEE
jgi:hypothetical protein